MFPFSINLTHSHTHFAYIQINSPHHEEIASLEVQLKAVQSRNSFLENELQSQSDKNSRILQEFDTMRELSDVKNKELRDKIHNLELSLLQQHDHFSKQIQGELRYIEKNMI